MHSYAALLGNNPSISIAELAAILPDFEKGHLIEPGPILSFSTAKQLDQAFLSVLGGTVLLAKRITSDAVTLRDIPSLLATELQGVKGKAVFSIRAVGLGRSDIRDLYRECKTGLKQRGVSSRYVGSEREPAKPILLHDEGILDVKKGCEIVILKDRHGLWIGRTVAAQDVKAYTFRDMEKPVRDTTVGLLPPKLAQVLLNLGLSLTKAKNPVVFDPFCGTGVIPIEVMLRHLPILASDVSLKAINGTEKNVDWVRKKFEIKKTDVPSTIWKQDATKPFDLKTKPDVIVTEGTLGPALKSRANVKEAQTYCREAEELTAAFLKNVHDTLPGTPVVMTLPVWYAQKKMVHLEKLWDRLPALGFKAVLPPHAVPAVDGHFSLLYRRSDQFVGREIVLLSPTE